MNSEIQNVENGENIMKKATIETAVQSLIDYAVEKELITADDEIYVRNCLMDILKLDNWSNPNGGKYGSVDEILDDIVDYAAEKEIIPASNAWRDLFDTKIMGVFTAMPHEIIKKFREKYSENPKAATDWYFTYSEDTNYVRKGRIAKDIRWKYDSEYGQLDITINRSKPEKDPRDIAAARNAVKVSYPACQLCMENMGFAGTLTHPARQNLRPIPMIIHGGKWGFQYSPYGYYNEHCIVFNSEHIPMKIDADVFGKLFDIIDMLPHYFVGSNADLPIVGGSILSHEHFQGGRYTFAMENAQVEHEFSLSGFDSVKAGIVKWPMSVVRLSGKNRAELESACDKILVAWRAYSDESVGIYAFTDGVPHNTITPIARRHGDEYECDLVLRNNITSEERPLGIFHPNPSLHHIKKENIGLIEVMGLAVLPARLANEITALSAALVNKTDLSSNENLSGHAEWMTGLYKKYPDVKAEDAEKIIKLEIGAVFEQVLLDAGVYKRDEKGREAFRRFIDSVK